MTAFLAIAIVALAVAALYFAGEAKDAKVAATKLETDLAQSQAALKAEQEAHKDDLHRFKSEATAYLAALKSAEDALEKSPDPDTRREHLRRLGGMLSALSRKDPNS